MKHTPNSDFHLFAVQLLKIQHLCIKDTEGQLRFTQAFLVFSQVQQKMLAYLSVIKNGGSCFQMWDLKSQTLS